MNDSIQRGDDPEARQNFAYEYRKKLLEQTKKRIEDDKKREKRFLKTGNFYYMVEKNENRPFFRMEKTDNNNNANMANLVGKGRYDNSIFQTALKKRANDYKELKLQKQGFITVNKDKSSVSSSNNIVNNIMVEIENDFLEGRFENIKVLTLRKLYSEIVNNATELTTEDIKKNASILANIIDIYFNPPADRTLILGQKVKKLPNMFNLSKSFILLLFKILNLFVIINGNINSQNLKDIIKGYSKTLVKDSIEASNDLYDSLTQEFPITLEKKDYSEAIKNRSDRLLKEEFDKKSISSIATEKRTKQTNLEGREATLYSEYLKEIKRSLEGKTFVDNKMNNISRLLDSKYGILSRDLEVEAYGNKYSIGDFVKKLQDVSDNRNTIQNTLTSLDWKNPEQLQAKLLEIDNLMTENKMNKDFIYNYKMGASGKIDKVKEEVVQSSLYELDWKDAAKLQEQIINISEFMDKVGLDRGKRGYRIRVGRRRLLDIDFIMNYIQNFIEKKV